MPFENYVDTVIRQIADGESITNSYKSLLRAEQPLDNSAHIIEAQALEEFIDPRNGLSLMIGQLGVINSIDNDGGDWVRQFDNKRRRIYLIKAEVATIADTSHITSKGYAPLLSVVYPQRSRASAAYEALTGTRRIKNVETQPVKVRLHYLNNPWLYILKHCN